MMRHSIRTAIPSLNSRLLALALALLLVGSGCSRRAQVDGETPPSSAPKFVRAPKSCGEVNLEDLFKSIAGPSYREPGGATPLGDGTNAVRNGTRLQESSGDGSGVGLTCITNFNAQDDATRSPGGPERREFTVFYMFKGDEDEAKRAFDGLYAGGGEKAPGPLAGQDAWLKNRDPSAKCEPKWEVDLRDSNLIATVTVEGQNYVKDSSARDPANRGKSLPSLDDQPNSDISCGDQAVSDQIRSSAINLAKALIDRLNVSHGLLAK
jgi:hypothetical protein